MTPLHPGFCRSLQVEPLTSIILRGMDPHDCSCLLRGGGAAAVCVQTRAGVCVNGITSDLTLIPSPVPLRCRQLAALGYISVRLGCSGPRWLFRSGCKFFQGESARLAAL